jgi:hypothetical protein
MAWIGVVFFSFSWLFGWLGLSLPVWQIVWQEAVGVANGQFGH